MVLRHKKDGWHVYSKSIDPRTGKRRHLGGPYSTKTKAEGRENQIRRIKHIKESYRKHQRGR